MYSIHPLQTFVMWDLSVYIKEGESRDRVGSQGSADGGYGSGQLNV